MPKPNWVKDDDIWAKAIKKIEDQEGKPQGEFSGPQHGMAAAEYKKMGGTSKGSQSESTTAAERILSVLDEMTNK